MASTVKLLVLFVLLSFRQGILSSFLKSHQGDHYLRHSLCPASIDFDVSDNYLFKYPVDIYDSKLNKKSTEDRLYRCSARRVNVYSQHHCAGKEINCPVTRDHVHSTLNATSWPVHNSKKITRILDQVFTDMHPISQKENQSSFRFIFLGGSVTAGHETEGYCCSNVHFNVQQRQHLLDARCNAANRCDKYFSSELPNFQHDGSISWVKYFSRALSRVSNVPLEFFSLAAPGTTSNYMASHFSGHLNKLPLRSNSSEAIDFIFIDYSYNDGRVFQGPKRGMLDQAIESLVRSVLTSYPPSQRPFITLLESYAHSRGVFGRGQDCATTSEEVEGGGGSNSSSGRTACTTTARDRDQKDSDSLAMVQSQSTSDYSAAYRRVAKHYGLLVWSARNVYWSLTQKKHQVVHDNGGSTGSSGGFQDYMLQGHPPWHTHLYWADVYLSLLQHELRGHLKKLEHSEGAGGDRNRYEAEGLGHTLPPALVKAEDISSQQCDWNAPILADLSFDFEGNINPSSDYSIIPEDSWAFVKEGGGRDKPGWITRDSFSNHTIEVHMNISHLLEWSRGKTKEERIDRLNHRDIVIVLSYLKSYEKMSSVSLEMCDHTITTENALWPDKFSLSYTSVLPIGHFIEKHCDSLIYKLSKEAEAPVASRSGSYSSQGSRSVFSVRLLSLIHI